MGEMGGRFMKVGTYTYPWLIHVAVWQKPTQYGKAVILQLNIKIKENHDQEKQSLFILEYLCMQCPTLTD